jgi:lipopolysaccharide assembly protein A
MRLIKLALLGVLMLAIVVLSLANRDPVTLKLLPEGLADILPYQLQVPLFAVILASIFAGLMIGYILEWLREHKHRRMATQKSREASRLEREVKKLKKKHMSEADEVLAILDDAPGRA